MDTYWSCLVAVCFRGRESGGIMTLTGAVLLQFVSGVEKVEG